MVSFAFWGEIWSVFARSTQNCLRLWLWSYLLSFQRLCYGDIFSIEAVHRDPPAVVKAWCTCDVQHPIGCVRRLHIVTCKQNHTATFTTTQLTQPHSHLQQSACLTRNSWAQIINSFITADTDIVGNNARINMLDWLYIFFRKLAFVKQCFRAACSPNTFIRQSHFNLLLLFLVQQP